VDLIWFSSPKAHNSNAAGPTWPELLADGHCSGPLPLDFLSLSTLILHKLM
jgi:hypothetical protein